MPANVRVVLNRRAVRDLLRSSEVVADLRARAGRIADAAGEGMEARTQLSKTRARAAVFTATPQARAAEAKNRTLTRALDAGR